jgi:hypothetical protein
MQLTGIGAQAPPRHGLRLTEGKVTTDLFQRGQRA